MIPRQITTQQWSSSIQEIVRNPARIKARMITGRMTSATSKGTITEDNQANYIRTLKGTLC